MLNFCLCAVISAAIIASVSHFTSLTVMAGISVFATYRFLKATDFHRRTPPGPRGLPIIGNLLQFSSKAWLDAARWKQAYGPLVFIRLLGQPVLLLNSHRAARDLLDRRAHVYSDRPRYIVATESLTCGLLFVLARSGPRWQTMRKLAQSSLTRPKTTKLRPVEEAESKLLVVALLNKNEKWLTHIKESASFLQFGLVYGLSMDNKKTRALAALSRINQFVERLVNAVYPGAHLVEQLPWMRHLPSWMMKWKRDARYWFEEDSRMFENLFEVAQSTTGETTPSFVNFLGQDHRCDLNVRESAWLAGTLYAAGTETTAGVLSWFILAMAAYPEVQQKAHTELDRVVGRSRVPCFADYDTLTYIQAIVKEALRWQPVSPLGMPHALTEDDWYEGYFIPKGTICLPNVWCMNRDPAVYGPDAEHFNPDRYLSGGSRAFSDGSANTNQEGHSSYGFGQRLCIGRNAANDVLFINMAVILWACDIVPGTGHNGLPVALPLNDAVDTGLVMRPADFSCHFRPRFPEVYDLLGYSTTL